MFSLWRSWLAAYVNAHYALAVSDQHAEQRAQIPTADEYEDNPLQWPDGTYSVQGAAAALSISTQTVFKWLQKGRSSGRQLAKGMPWQITLSSPQIAELRTQVQRANQSKKEAS
jgi:hypothetical protein